MYEIRKSGAMFALIEMPSHLVLMKTKSKRKITKVWSKLKLDRCGFYGNTPTFFSMNREYMNE